MCDNETALLYPDAAESSTGAEWDGGRGKGTDGTLSAGIAKLNSLFNTIENVPGEENTLPER